MQVVFGGEDILGDVIVECLGLQRKGRKFEAMFDATMGGYSLDPHCTLSDNGVEDGGRLDGIVHSTVTGFRNPNFRAMTHGDQMRLDRLR